MRTRRLRTRDCGSAIFIGEMRQCEDGVGVDGFLLASVDYDWIRERRKCRSFDSPCTLSSCLRGYAWGCVHMLDGLDGDGDGDVSVVHELGGGERG